MRRPAVTALEEARERAVELLWPPVVGQWLRLAVLCSFVGGFGGVGTAGGNVQSVVPVSGGGVLSRLPPVSLGVLPPSERLLWWAAAAGLVALAVVSCYALVGAVAEFALYGALRDGEVGLRTSARRYAGPGLRLFSFRVAVVAAALVVGGGPLALAAWGTLRTSPALALLVVPALLFGLVVALLVWVVLTLTTDLVVPAVLASDAPGPLAGWRRVAPLISANAVDVVLYLLVRVVLGVAAGVVVGLVGGLVALVVGVPFAVVAAASLAAAGETLSAGGLAGLVALGAAFVGVVATLLQVVRTPVVVYRRAYAGSTLGRLAPGLAPFADTDGAESLRPERRT